MSAFSNDESFLFFSESKIIGAQYLVSAILLEFPYWVKQVRYSALRNVPILLCNIAKRHIWSVTRQNDDKCQKSELDARSKDVKRNVNVYISLHMTRDSGLWRDIRC